MHTVPEGYRAEFAFPPVEVRSHFSEPLTEPGHRSGWRGATGHFAIQDAGGPDMCCDKFSARSPCAGRVRVKFATHLLVHDLREGVVVSLEYP